MFLFYNIVILEIFIASKNDSNAITVNPNNTQFRSFQIKSLIIDKGRQSAPIKSVRMIAMIESLYNYAISS